MPKRVPLVGGAYTARSLIANAQRCVNLFPEVNPDQDEPPTQVTHYPTPGLKPIGQPEVGTVRCVYRATNGALFMVINDSVYFVDLVINFGFYRMGTITAGTTPVFMSDNGNIVVLVDGTTNGYKWTLGVNTMTKIVDAAFYGADYVDFLDGFFVFNRPDTNEFYLSPSFWNGSTAFDPTYIASKTGGADQIIALQVVHRELWLIGQLTTEVWYNSGATDFPFERLPGVFVDHGMTKGYSVAKADITLFWLGRDRQGQSMVFQGLPYEAVRVSTHALENEIRGYADVTDAVGFCYQQNGHTFYVLTFPSADKTWVFDMSTHQWHERAWIDSDGQLHAHRAYCAVNAYNRIVCGDRENGWLYQWDADTYDDNGSPIVRIRSWPHLIADGRRCSYDMFMMDLDCGLPDGGGDDGPSVSLRWSDDRGHSWGDAIELPMGATGDFSRTVMQRNLGYARDRVFEVSWSFPYETALQGAFIERTVAET